MNKTEVLPLPFPKKVFTPKVRTYVHVFFLIRRVFILLFFNSLFLIFLFNVKFMRDICIGILLNIYCKIFSIKKN